jgi:CRISPR system Cascade subunit CasC
MHKFISIHTVRSLGINNCNRDDMGRPKTAYINGTERARISSQCLKRHFRMSEPFDGSNRSTRTKQMGDKWITPYLSQHLSEELVHSWLKRLLSVYGKVVEKDGVSEMGQIVLITTEEKALLDVCMETIVRIHTQGVSSSPNALEMSIQKVLEIPEPQEKLKKPKKPKKGKENGIEEGESSEDSDNSDNEEVETEGGAQKKYLKKVAKILQPFLLGNSTCSLDAALWGRRLAEAPEYNITAACQVAHTFTLDAVKIGTDYFTAVDDLNTTDQQGSGHLGEASFTSGVYLSQVLINTDVLLSNLKGDVAAMTKALQRMVEVIITVTPSGKQATMLNQNFSQYLVIEKSDHQLISYGNYVSTPPIRGNITAEVMKEVALRFRNTLAEHDACYPSLKIERLVVEKALTTTGGSTFDDAVAFVVA